MTTPHPTKCKYGNANCRSGEILLTMPPQYQECDCEPAHENSNQRSMTSDERKELDNWTMSELKPHENDGNALGRILQEIVFQAGTIQDRQERFDYAAAQFYDEILRRDGDRVAELEAEAKVRDESLVIWQKQAQRFEDKVRELERKLSAWENQAKASQRKVAELQVEVERLRKVAEWQGYFGNDTIVKGLQAEVERLKGALESSGNYKEAWHAMKAEFDLRRTEIERLNTKVRMLEDEVSSMESSDLREFTLAAMQGLCGNAPSWQGDVSGMAIIIAKDTLAALRKEQE